MSRDVILLAKAAAAEIRAAAAELDDEDGGALVGDPETGDVFAQVRAPRTASRSRVHIRLQAAELEEGVREALRVHPGSAWIGHWHVHDRLATLSTGDHAQLERLHGDPRVPRCGLVALLLVKRREEGLLLRGWRSPAAEVIEELDVLEADDPRVSRLAIAPAVAVPPVRLHCIGTAPGVARFEQELRELADAGFTVDAATGDRGVEVSLTHREQMGTLHLTIPAEGWERPPRAEIFRRGRGVLLNTLGLSVWLSGWSSAFRLIDLVEYVRGARHWPRRAVRIASDGKRSAA